MSLLTQQVEAQLARAEVPAMREEPRFLASLDLVALPTAVNVARMFISETLNRWRALFIEEYLAAVGVELVTLAVDATKPDENTSWNDLTEISPITLRLLGYRRHIVFEVTDQHDEMLVFPDDVYVPEGVGLGLVEALSSRWGSFVAPRGRVSWAELAVYERTEAGLPRREPTAQTESGDRDESPSPRHDPELLRRVVEGLKNL